MKVRIQPAALLLASGYFIYVLSGLLAEGTWDDDCISRYYNTRNAFSDYKVWISLFHRPLWVILFAIPVQLGYWVVPVIMSALCAITAYALYRSAKIKGQQHAWFVIILLLFQPYFFGVGKDALTEPLAALLMALGYWALLKKQYRWFVICGALLPLARLEGVVLLAFWAIPLIRHKQWKHIPFLGAGMLAWNIAGMLFSASADPIWLVHEVLNRGEDPYGEVSFFAFMGRYYYVVGPVTFLFLVIGLLETMLQRKFDLFIHGQFWCGILLYSILAGWDTARSGGFLRHMIVVGPFAALIALDGFNHTLSLLQRARTRRRLAIYLAFVLVICWIWFRNHLEGHHEYTDTFSWINFPSLVVLVLGIVVLGFLSRTRIKMNLMPALGIGISVMAVSFTLITEHPGASINPERQALHEVIAIYRQTDLHSKALIASHPHFLKKINASQWKKNDVTRHNLLKAQEGTVVVWDGHYSTPRKGGLNNTEIPGLGYIELFRVLATDNSYSVIVYEKKDRATTDDVEDRLNELMAAIPTSPHLYFGLARHQYLNKNYQRSEQNIMQALALDSNQFVFHLMLGDLAYLDQEIEKALQYYTKSIQLCPRQMRVHTIMGNLHYQLKHHESAVNAYTDALNFNKNDVEAYLMRGRAHQELGQIQAACQDWEKAKELGHAQAKKQFARYCND